MSSLISANLPNSDAVPSTLQSSDHPLPKRTPPASSSWQSVIATFGLPCIIGVAVIDPGNLEVDLQAGAGLGYSLLWALLLSSVLGCILQTLAAHLSICTGSDLAHVCAQIYRRDLYLSRSMFVLTELSIIAFDVAEVVGTAFGLRLLIGCPIWVGMILSALDTVLVIFLQRTGMSRVELIVEGLLLILAACLIYEFTLSTPSVPAMIEGTFLPSFGNAPSKGIVLAVSIMGSVIMSHNLFLHSWLVKERQSEQSNVIPSTDIANTSVFSNNFSHTDLNSACRYAGFESLGVFLVTFLINGCVVVVAANLPRAAVSSYDNFGLEQAGALLHNVLGQRFASKAWAIALLASGHAATVTGTLASQAVCEGFLDIRPGRSSAALIMSTRLVAIIPAVIAAIAAGQKGSDNLAVMSQMVLSFALPFAAVPLFKVLDAVANATEAYGRNLLRAGYLVFSVVMIANGYAVWQVGKDAFAAHGLLPVLAFIGVLLAGIALLVRLIVTPVHVSDLLVVGEIPLCIDEERQRILTDKRRIYS